MSENELLDAYWSMGYQERTCPCCRRRIFYKEFLDMNVSILKDKCPEIWNNDDLSIFCCSCYNIISLLFEYEYYIIQKDVDLYSLHIHNFENSFFYINTKVYNRLQELGLIE